MLSSDFEGRSELARLARLSPLELILMVVPEVTYIICSGESTHNYMSQIYKIDYYVTSTLT